jgi:hypothetical protein
METHIDSHSCRDPLDLGLRPERVASNGLHNGDLTADYRAPVLLARQSLNGLANILELVSVVG